MLEDARNEAANDVGCSQNHGPVLVTDYVTAPNI